MVAPGFFHIHFRNALSDTLGLEQRRRPSVFFGCITAANVHL